jgi:excisionase family DNA binding protein
MAQMKLLTAAQVAEQFGIPSARTVRTMRANGLPFVRLGKASLFDVDDVAAFIAASKESLCPVRTPARASNGSSAGNRSISSGTPKGNNGSKRLDAAIDKLLRPRSQNTSDKATGSPTGQVIRADFG